MTEGMKLSTKTEAAPLLESEGTGSNGALQLLANRYAKRLARIRAMQRIAPRSASTSAGGVGRMSAKYANWAMIFSLRFACETTP